MPFDVQHLLLNTILVLVVFLLSFSIYYLINIGNTKVSLRNRLKFDQIFIKRTAIIIILILITLFIFNKYPIVSRTLSTAIISIIVAYLINPLVIKLENLGLKRSYAILIVYLIVILFFAIIVVFLWPMLVEQLKNLVQSIPQIVRYVNRLSDKIGGKFKDYPAVNDFILDGTKSILKSLNKVQDNLIFELGNIGEKVSGLASGILRIVLIPVFTFYFIMFKEKYFIWIKKQVPANKYKGTVSLFREVDRVNSQFVRGRLIMAIAVGIMTTIFLLIMRIDYALIIGIITCVADIIPYIGPALGFIPAVVLALVDSPIKAVIVAIAFVLIQWVENNILAPKILGTTIGLNPLLILVSLIIGAGMFGVPGMIFAVPVVATLKVVTGHFKNDIKNFFFDNNHRNI
ncbi:AI-2E family transporter [Lagierella massiliensis]|uniref:AI-2E family transporter n=1 Tax=Lagierella massiliensis TaxID=1689303 RepID=UPI0006D85EE6|nr:AI-2E family transporter [Lagierella massiliensis]